METVAGSSKNLDRCQLIKNSQCLKISEKVAFNIASEASCVYILRGQKLIKNAKIGPFVAPIFVILKVNCLVTLLDHQLQVIKICHFGHFSGTFVHSICKCSSLRSQCWMRLFLKIFKHYELSETSGKLTCLHKTSRHFRKGNSKLYCMSQPNITCADFELFKKDFFNMCVTKV